MRDLFSPEERGKFLSEWREYTADTDRKRYPINHSLHVQKEIIRCSVPHCLHPAVMEVKSLKKGKSPPHPGLCPKHFWLLWENVPIYAERRDKETEAMIESTRKLFGSRPQ